MCSHRVNTKVIAYMFTSIISSLTALFVLYIISTTILPSEEFTNFINSSLFTILYLLFSVIAIIVSPRILEYYEPEIVYRTLIYVSIVMYCLTIGLYFTGYTQYSTMSIVIASISLVLASILKLILKWVGRGAT